MSTSTNSHTNPVLNDLRNGEQYKGMTMAERIQDQWDYITDGFGTVALDDGIYTEEDIKFAWKVLAYLATDDDSPEEEAEALDVWLKFDEAMAEANDLDTDTATHEANTYISDTGYRIEWYLNSVGLVKTVEFATIEEAHAWYAAEGFQDFSS